MKVMEKNVMRLVAVQQLRTAYGIKTKNWNKNKATSCRPANNSSMKVFGVHLELLPYYNMEFGSVPSFLVDACMKLLAHVDTEGLFRKSGSVIRLKALRAKLDAEEECLSTALPCDVAGLVKQFFRELPEPVLPAELQEAFLKAQQLHTEEERTSATMLLSCVLPDRNLSVLRYFFDFLQNVSKRSAENKMDSSNLSVILAPNLLHFGDATEKMTSHTEKRLKLQASVVHCFIENAHHFGVLPQFLVEKVPAMMGSEVGSSSSPTHHELEELDVNSGLKRKQRRSFGVFSSATPVIATPTSKRKLPLDSGHSFGFSNKKRRSLRKNLNIDLLPNTLFSAASTPGSAYSASGVLDASQNNQMSAGKSRKPSATSARRKSRRRSNKHVSRVESGKAGCFSPKVDKKEGPRKSLRMRFSLGKSSKDAGTESIGWRLATQESTSSFQFTTETRFTPSARKTESKSSKVMSKSEDNLLTPQYDSSAHRTSWNGSTPSRGHAFGAPSFTDTPMNVCMKTNYVSEPIIVLSKPPPTGGLPMKLCCASSVESLDSERCVTQTRKQTLPTQFKASKTVAESKPDIQALVQDSTEANVTQSVNRVPVSAPQSPPDTEQKATFSRVDFSAFTPLHIDSVILERDSCFPLRNAADKDSLLRSSHEDSVEDEGRQVNCSRLIDALDIQSPTCFTLGVCSGLQSTPYKQRLELQEQSIIIPQAGEEVGTAEGEEVFPSEMKSKEREQQSSSLCPSGTEKPRVADHILHFNKLTLRSPKEKQVRSPLRFQRTPVRQTVRRFNSLLGDRSRPQRKADLTTLQSAPMEKAVSLESALSPHPQAPPPKSRKIPPPVPPKKLSTLARKPKPSALGDVTNMPHPIIKDVCSTPDPSGVLRPLVQHVAEKDMSRYRGSPRNPLTQTRLLSATKPVDL
ncbi:rho GTPase-activating protein 11A isoform X2 [Gouania willdenowi]|uniref:Rho GTPase-activating protein 11A-like n=1 Tax=Gouania willdenowi TaxID=441366 RepID=A0A8C5NBL8_GOUWI|nr:rho GTPase-activating protein 11A-like isoform X2 [Gouania willdenowi]